MPTTGMPHPGAQYPPPSWQQQWQPGPAGGHRPAGNRLMRGLALGAGAVALSLCSGLFGGIIAVQVDDDPATTTVTRNAAPVVDRSTVADVAEAVMPSVVDIATESGEGSGVVLTADGAVLTNNHVIASAKGETVTVTFSGGKTAKATIVGTDPVDDLAVIKAQGVSGLTPAKWGDSSALRIGDTVLALGSPLGLKGSVTEGIVSALNRSIDAGESGSAGSTITDAIQTDAAINPGNSGGPLVNLAGEVIGINTAIATSGQGSGSIGLGFAIPSNKAKSAADQLLSGGKVTHPYLGIQVGDGDGGALVSDVVANGPAAKAGLQKGDIITKVGSRTVTDANELVAAVQAGKPGDQVQITIRRNGMEQQVTATLGSK